MKIGCDRTEALAKATCKDEECKKTVVGLISALEGVVKDAGEAGAAHKDGGKDGSDERQGGSGKKSDSPSKSPGKQKRA